MLQSVGVTVHAYYGVDAIPAVRVLGVRALNEYQHPIAQRIAAGGCSILTISMPYSGM